MPTLTQPLLDALFSTDDGLREAAAQRLDIVGTGQMHYDDYLVEVTRALGTLGDRLALPKFHALLAHPDIRVQTNAAAGIAAIFPEEGGAILEILMEQNHRSTRCEVVRVLCDIEAPEIKRTLARALMTLYQGQHIIDPSDDWTRGLRWRMARALGRPSDSYAVPALTLAAGDTDLKVRGEALAALGRVRDSAALPTLIDGVDDPHWKVRRKAIVGLRLLGSEQVIEPIVRKLSDPEEDVVVAAIDALRLIGNPSVRPELVRVIGGKSDRAARAAATALLQDQSDVSMPMLLAGLSNSSSETRIAVVPILGAIGDVTAMPNLVTVLESDPEVPVQMAAARALGRLGSRSAVPHLVKCLESGAAWPVRRAAAVALGALGDSSAVAPLKRATRSGNAGLEKDAQMALVRMGEDVMVIGSPDGPAGTRPRAKRLLMKAGRFDLRL